MILELLDKKIGEMKELQSLKLKKQNQDQQNAIDERYKKLVLDVNKYVSIYDYIRKNLDFNPSDELKAKSRDLLLELQNAIKNGDADKDIVNSADNKFKTVISTMTKEWNLHFIALTRNTTNSLRIISGIDSDKVKKCLTGINAAEKWNLDKQIFEKLKTSLDVANELIFSLKLKQPIVEFLTKMTSGRATVEDLDETILAWLSEEGISKKIKLSFDVR